MTLTSCISQVQHKYIPTKDIESPPYPFLTYPWNLVFNLPCPQASQGETAPQPPVNTVDQWTFKKEIASGLKRKNMEAFTRFTDIK